MNKGKELKFKKIIKNLKQDKKCNVFEESLKEYLKDEYDTCMYDLEGILFQKKKNLLNITSGIMRDLEINKNMDMDITEKTYYVNKFSDEIDKVLEEETKKKLYVNSNKDSINKYLINNINKPIDFENECKRIFGEIHLELNSCELISDSLKVINEYINCNNVKN